MRLHYGIGGVDQMSAIKKHSKLSASAMERWGECPGSVRMCEGMPSIESEAAREGTMVHDYCEQFLRGDFPADKFHKLPEEQQEAIKLYADTVFDQCEAHPKCEMGVEHHFDLSSVYPGCYGTCDSWVWNPKTRVLYVNDFKYGKGVFVEVEDNWQLQYYALGALVTLGFPALEIEITIIQPRCASKKGEKVRRWRVPVFQLLEFEDFLVTKAKATEDPKAPLVPGRYCYWCPGHTRCPAKTAERLAAAIDSFGPLPDEEDPFA
jgi:hypothetical protein